MVELGLVGNQPHAAAAQLLGQADGLAVGVLAGDGAAAVAHPHGQVDAHVGEVAQDREPHLGRHAAHAREKDLVLLGQAPQRAGASDVRMPVRTCRLGDLFVHLVRGVVHVAERLDRARGHAQAALAARVGHVDRVARDLDGAHRAHVDATDAGRRVGREAAHARGGAGTGTPLIATRVPLGLGAGLGGKRVGEVAQRVLDRGPVLLDIDDVVEKVALLRHRPSLGSTTHTVVYCTPPIRRKKGVPRTWHGTPNKRRFA